MVYFFCDEIHRIPHDEMLKSFFRELVSNVNDRVKVVSQLRACYVINPGWDSLGVARDSLDDRNQ
jgi:hypothetical protein